MVPNAELTIRQAGAGESRTTRSNANGEFKFKWNTLNDVTLRVDQTISLRITPEIGRSSETVGSHRISAAVRFRYLVIETGNRE